MNREKTVDHVLSSVVPFPFFSTFTTCDGFRVMWVYSFRSKGHTLGNG